MTVFGMLKIWKSGYNICVTNVVVTVLLTLTVLAVPLLVNLLRQKVEFHLVCLSQNMLKLVNTKTNQRTKTNEKD